MASNIAPVELAEDTTRQAERQAEVKETVGSRVNEEITAEAATASPAEHEKVVEVATKIRGDAIDDTAKADRAVGHARTAARGSQFVDYGFGVLYALLAIRLVLALIAARSSNGFVQLIATVTAPFYAPFEGIVSSPSSEAGHTLIVPLLVAIVAYALLHAAVNGLLRMVSSRKTAI